jgi:chemotaxis family two-component system sensor histidine kinase/response regulator PixL
MVGEESLSSSQLGEESNDSPSTVPKASKLNGQPKGRDVTDNVSKAAASSQLTLTTSKRFVCMADSVILTLPFEDIAEIAMLQENRIRQSEKRRWLNWREKTIPLYQLSELLARSYLSTSTSPAAKRRLSSILVYGRGDRTLALELKIERLIAEPELIVQPFEAAIARPRYLYGCTISKEGRLIPVIDGTAFLNSALSDDERNAIATAMPAQRTISEKTARPPTLLVVDDSITVRLALYLTLQQAGYKVLQARDGWHAIEQLQRHPNIQSIVCDLEMPNMSGFEFLMYCRQSSDLAKIPVVILSIRSNEQHQKRATSLGAKAYLIKKPDLEKELLATLQALLLSEPTER